jgi:hypothetical protein
MSKTITPTTSEAARPTAIQKKAAAMSDADLVTLGKRARTEPEAAKEYLDLMVEAGLLNSLTRSIGMAQQAESSLLKSLSTTDELTKETWRRHMEHIRRDLAGDNATPLERVLNPCKE